MHAIWKQLKRVYGVEFTAVRIYSNLTALGATMADIPERRSRPGSAYLIPGHVGHRGAFHPSLLNIFVGHRYYGVQTGAALREHGKRAAGWRVRASRQLQDRHVPTQRSKCPLLPQSV